MSGARKRAPSKEVDEYSMKRQRNNEAVNRTRQKKRQEENETADRVDELRKENEQLERKVETLQRELGFLKDMFVAYAKGGKPDETGASSSASDSQASSSGTSSSRTTRK